MRSQEFFLGEWGRGGGNVVQLLPQEHTKTTLQKGVLPSSMLVYHIRKLRERHGNGELG